MHKPDDELRIDFGPGRKLRFDSVDVETGADIPQHWDDFAVNVSTLSFEGKRELRGAGIVAQAKRVSFQDLEVTICIDPTLQDVAAGTYQGKVWFNDPRLEELEIEVTVFAQQTNAWVWIVASVLGALLASSLAFSLHGQRVELRNLRGFRKWLPALVFIAAGFAAAFTGTVRVYSADRSWGANGFDGLLLTGQAIAFAYGATVATTDIGKALGFGERPGRSATSESPMPPEG